jgi:hypothetical protein
MNPVKLARQGLIREAFDAVLDESQQKTPAKVARTNPKLAFEMVLAMEHDSPEALKEYLKEHPNADKSNHTVKKQDESAKKQDEKEGGKSSIKDLKPNGSRDERGDYTKALSDATHEATKKLEDLGDVVKDYDPDKFEAVAKSIGSELDKMAEVAKNALDNPMKASGFEEGYKKVMDAVSEAQSILSDHGDFMGMTAIVNALDPDTKQENYDDEAVVEKFKKALEEIGEALEESRDSWESAYRSYWGD